MTLTFLSYTRVINCEKCACCGAEISRVVTLSDGNKYGIDCAKNLCALPVSKIKEIDIADKSQNLGIWGVKYDGSYIWRGYATSESTALRNCIKAKKWPSARKSQMIANYLHK